MFEVGIWRITVDENGEIIQERMSNDGAGEWTDGLHMLEVCASDLRRALGKALDAILRYHGHTLAEVEAAGKRCGLCKYCRLHPGPSAPDLCERTDMPGEQP